MTPKQRAERNLRPHKAAVAAMWIWHGTYAAQRGGSMDFWDRLSDTQKNVARDLVRRMAKAPAEKSA